MNATSQPVIAPANSNQIKAVMQNERWDQSNAIAYNRYRMISCRRNWQRLLSTHLVSVPKASQLLEIGAGTGFITELLVGLGYRVTATDLSPFMLALAQKNLTAAGMFDSVHLQQGDAEHLDYENNAFEAVVSRWLLWTLPQPEKALSEMVRTLKPGGRLVLIDGRHLQQSGAEKIRAALFDLLLTGRSPGWKPPAYTTVFENLPRLDLSAVVKILQDKGLQDVTGRRLDACEEEGRLMNWLMGASWQSYIVTATKEQHS